jgi:CheY-like chemotaxis protein
LVPETLDEFLMTRPPTAERPLLGQTILVVDDSRFACEGLRLICQRSGARIRRADSLRSADRHLRTYRPGIVLVDVGLPDGSGLDLIRRLVRTDPAGPVVLAMSGEDAHADEARAAGAEAFITKPIASIAFFQSAILAALPKDARPTAIRAVHGDEVIPDRIALRDDLSLAAELLRGPADRPTMSYLGAFLFGVAKSAYDPDLVDAATNLSLTAESDNDMTAAVEMLSRMVATRLDEEQTV